MCCAGSGSDDDCKFCIHIDSAQIARDEVYLE